MPITPNTVHMDSILTNLSVAFFQDPAAYVADKVFPVVPVQKKSDKFFVFDKESLLRDEAAPRGPKDLAAEVDSDVAQDDYSCTTYSAKKLVPDEVVANADTPYDPTRHAVEVVTQKLRTKAETLFASNFLSAGKWGTDIAGADTNPTDSQVLRWSAANSSPLGNIEDAKLEVQQKSGFIPNTLVIGYTVWSVLKRHPEIIDLIKYDGQSGTGTRQQLTEDAVAQVLGLENVYVSRAVVNTAKEGKAAAYSSVVGKGALLTYTTGSPALDSPTAGYTFLWDGISEGLGATIGTRSYPVTERRSTAIESDIAIDQKIVAKDLGVFFNGIVA